MKNMNQKEKNLLPEKKPFTWRYQGKVMAVNWQVSGMFRGTDSLEHLTNDGLKTLCGVKLTGGKRYSEWSGNKATCTRCTNKAFKMGLLETFI